MRIPKIVCPHCGQEISKSKFTKHLRRHKNRPGSFKENVVHVTHEGLNCQYCGKLCKSKNSLAQHEIRCKQNPQRKCFNNLSNEGWSKGLTKETDERILRCVIANKGKHKSFLGKHHTEETKEKIRQFQLNCVDHDSHNRNSRGKRGYYNGIFFMSTWELAYYLYMKEDNDIIRCPYRYDYVYKGKKHKYSPDFLLNGKIVVEIKGREKELDRIKYSLVKDIKVIKYDEMIPIIKLIKERYQVENIEDIYDKYIGV